MDVGLARGQAQSRMLTRALAHLQLLPQLVAHPPQRQPAYLHIYQLLVPGLEGRAKVGSVGGGGRSMCVCGDGTPVCAGRQWDYA